MYEKHVREMFERIDAKNIDGFMRYLTENVRFQFASAPQVSGSQEVRAAVAHVFSAIAGLRHSILASWEFGNTAIVKLDVEYTRLDGSRVTLPCANIFEFHEGRIADYRIYMDIAPALSR